MTEIVVLDQIQLTVWWQESKAAPSLRTLQIICHHGHRNAFISIKSVSVGVKRCF